MNFELIQNIWWVIATMGSIVSVAIAGGIAYSRLEGRTNYLEKELDQANLRTEAQSQRIHEIATQVNSFADMKTDIKWIKEWLERVIDKIKI
jgi:uncharacterized protein (DUF697 family)